MNAHNMSTYQHRVSKKALWLSKPCTHTSACSCDLSDVIEHIPQVTFGIAFLLFSCVFISFFCVLVVHSDTYSTVSHRYRMNAAVWLHPHTTSICSRWVFECFFWSDHLPVMSLHWLSAHAQKHWHWQQPAGAERSVTAAGVAYLLPGCSRDRDLDRDRAWRRDRLWLTLWSAASTGHSGQKASHAPATEGGNDRRLRAAMKRHRLFLLRASSALQFLQQRSPTVFVPRTSLMSDSIFRDQLLRCGG